MWRYVARQRMRMSRPSRCVSSTPVKLDYPWSLASGDADREELALPSPVRSPYMDFMAWWQFHAMRLMVNANVDQADFLRGCRQVFHRINDIIGNEQADDADGLCKPALVQALRTTFESNAAKSSLRPSLEISNLTAWVGGLYMDPNEEGNELWATIDVLYSYTARILYQDRETSRPVDVDDDANAQPQARLSMYRLQGCVMGKARTEWVVSAIV